MRKRHGALAVLLAAIAALAVACSGGGDEAPPADQPAATLDTAGTVTAPVSAVGPGITVTDALTSTLEGPLLVNGFVVAKDGETRLCENLAESLPPQCAGASLEVAGLDLETVEGVVEQGGVVWTDAPVQVLGTVEDGALAVAANASAAGTVTRPSKPVAPAPGDITLTPGQPVDVAGRDVTITLVGVVQDSRCPTDVTCIRAGEATVDLHVRVGGQEADLRLEVSAPGAGGESFAGVEFIPVTLEPRPVSTRTIAPGDYRLTLRLATP